MRCSALVKLAAVVASINLVYGSEKPVSFKDYRESLGCMLEQCENKGDLTRVIESERQLYNKLLEECELLNGAPSPAANTSTNLNDTPNCQHKNG